MYIDKTIKDLTLKELIEDLEYYILVAQIKSPDFVDNTFEIIREYTTELKLRKLEEGGKKS